MAETATKVETLEEVLIDRDPFCGGICSVPEHQLLLYYAQGKDFHINRIDFAHSTIEDLEALSEACKPASSDFINKDTLDESYRKMDLNTFSTSFDPRRIGIHDIIEQDLLSTNQTVELELHELNVYGKHGFSKAHRDAPRGDNMFGTLVIVLPAPHEGGQLSVRVKERQWTVNFTDQLAAMTESSVCFVAFLGDVERQVLPVTSGYHVTLTYSLYFRPETQRDIPRLCRLPSSFHDRLKEALIQLVNDPETLPNGGYLALGLCYPYVYDGTRPVDSLRDRLRGPDAALARVCTALGLPCVLRLVYTEGVDIMYFWPKFHLLSRVKLSERRSNTGWGYSSEHLHELFEEAVRGLTRDDLEGIEFVGCESAFAHTEEHDSDLGSDYRFMKKFYNDPVSQVLNVKELSSVISETSFACASDPGASLECFYGSAAVVISVKPMESRERLAM